MSVLSWSLILYFEILPYSAKEATVAQGQKECVKHSGFSDGPPLLVAPSVYVCVCVQVVVLEHISWIQNDTNTLPRWIH